MRTKKVTVGLGATVPHPLEAYANLKMYVEFEAELEPDATRETDETTGGEAWEAAVTKLKLRAQRAVREGISEMIQGARQVLDERRRANELRQELSAAEAQADVPF